MGGEVSKLPVRVECSKPEVTGTAPAPRESATAVQIDATRVLIFGGAPIYVVMERISKARALSALDASTRCSIPVGRRTESDG
eukprot:5611757-Pyramimonas_sp.AAC.3